MKILAEEPWPAFGSDFYYRIVEFDTPGRCQVTECKRVAYFGTGGSGNMEVKANLEKDWPRVCVQHLINTHRYNKGEKISAGPEVDIVSVLKNSSSLNIDELLEIE